MASIVNFVQVNAGWVGIGFYTTICLRLIVFVRFQFEEINDVHQTWFWRVSSDSPIYAEIKIVRSKLIEQHYKLITLLW